MGCHTWCYIPENITEEQVRESAQKYLNFWILRWKMHLNNKDYRFFTKEEIIKLVATYERFMIFFDKRLFKIKTLYENFQLGDELRRYRDNKFYIEEDTHDIFRVGNYPEDILYSVEETLEFCKTRDKELTTEEYKKVDDFFTKYPEGIILFG